MGGKPPVRQARHGRYQQGVLPTDTSSMTLRGSGEGQKDSSLRPHRTPSPPLGPSSTAHTTTLIHSHIPQNCKICQFTFPPNRPPTPPSKQKPLPHKNYKKPAHTMSNVRQVPIKKPPSAGGKDRDTYQGEATETTATQKEVYTITHCLCLTTSSTGNTTPK